MLSAAGNNVVGITTIENNLTISSKVKDAHTWDSENQYLDIWETLSPMLTDRYTSN